MDYDVIVVGGGPVGGFIAGRLSKSGYSVLILEEHNKPGLPVQCAGLVTTKLQNIVDLKDCILNTVNGAHIFSPSGHGLLLDSGKPKAHVIDRSKFDQDILNTAIDSGAEIKFGEKLTGMSHLGESSSEGIGITVSSKSGTENYSTSLIVGADGATSKVRSISDLPSPRMYLRGFGMEYKYNDIPDEFVQIFSGNSIAPGFFAWVIPTGSVVRIGLCITEGSGNLQDFYNNFHKLCLGRGLIPDEKQIRTITGTIPIGALAQTTSDNIMLAGDAAAQVKPTSGGGLFPGLRCAELCAGTAAEALDDEDFSNEKLAEYHRAWKKSVGNELVKGFRLHKAFLQLSDEKLEEAFDILDKPEILEVISRKGDIESPFKLAKLLFKKAPRLIKFAGPYFKTVFH